MRKAIVLTAGLGLALMGFANDGPEVIRDRSVLGFWQFNDPANFKKDSSPWGNDITGDFPSGMSGLAADSVIAGGYDGSGCLSVSGGSKTKPLSVTAALTHGPAFNNTTSPYFTCLARIRSSKSYSDYRASTRLAGDSSQWHFFAYRYQVGGKTWDTSPFGGAYKYMLVIDPGLLWEGTSFWDNKSRPEETSNSTFSMPLGVSGSSVNIGGCFYSSSYFFEGKMDDLVVVNRLMGKNEITRHYLTGETYIYATGTPSFSTSDGWSSGDYVTFFSPGDVAGAAYIVDGGKTITQGATATFGGDGFTGSLTMGRLEPLMNRVANPNAVLVAASAGNLAHNTANTTITIGDLRLRKGKITSGAAGQTLAATKLEVVAPLESPYEIAIASGTYSIKGVASGEGWLKKTGTGTLDLTGLTGAAKVVVSGGKVLAGPNVTVTYAEDEGAVPVLMVE